MVSTDWGKLLEDLRVQREEEVVGKFLERYRVHFSSVSQQLTSYCEQLDRSRNGEVSSDKEHLKSLIDETRKALRFGMACLSVQDSETRRDVQNEAIAYGWHMPLPRILSHPKGDAKSRLTTSRLLSNLVTSNAQSALVIFTSVPLGPSRTDISFRIREGLSEANAKEEQNVELVDPNWTEMMLCAARCGCRNTLAAVVAALHNCISSTQDASLAKDIASHRLLICTLLRQLVSIKGVQESLKESEQQKQKEDGKDPATEWISILLTKLCRMGFLAEVYQAAGGEQASAGTIFPEQTLLLHCLREEVDSMVTDNYRDTFERNNPLGGEASKDSATASCFFLVQQYSIVRGEVASEMDNDELITGLRQSALLTILDIMSEALGVDTEATAAMRLSIGRETTFVHEVALDLGKIVDHLSTLNSGRKVRDISMLDEDRQTITGLVRTLGNLCFGCRPNQDLLRTLIVSPADGKVVSERSALHVLLSCTSFSHSCFTLREWAVVAIRNALDNNDHNQAEVAKLEGQQPVQSAELNDMGVRVEMDPRGKVSVVPLDKIPEGAHSGDSDDVNKA
jgi:ataxin-10